MLLLLLLLLLTTVAALLMLLQVVERLPHLCQLPTKSTNICEGNQSMTISISYLVALLCWYL